jgi:hypothetical protein
MPENPGPHYQMKEMGRRMKKNCMAEEFWYMKKSEVMLLGGWVKDPIDC